MCGLAPAAAAVLTGAAVARIRSTLPAAPPNCNYAVQLTTINSAILQEAPAAAKFAFGRACRRLLKFASAGCAYGAPCLLYRQKQGINKPTHGARPLSRVLRKVTATTGEGYRHAARSLVKASLGGYAASLTTRLLCLCQPQKYAKRRSRLSRNKPSLGPPL